VAGEALVIVADLFATAPGPLDIKYLPALSKTTGNKRFFS
jgi:hypothetical protein